MLEEQFCRECGCVVGEDAYEEDGVLYCCEPCYTDGECECGCCEVMTEEDE